MLKKRLMLVATLLLLVACQKAVQAPAEAVYAIRGNKLSPLYPVEVKQNSEDVYITLKSGAPLPEITSYDLAGNRISFNFSLVENTIVVPGKFQHLQLAHDKDDVVDIIRQND